MRQVVHAATRTVLHHDGPNHLGLWRYRLRRKVESSKELEAMLKKMDTFMELKDQVCVCSFSADLKR